MILLVPSTTFDNRNAKITVLMWNEQNWTEPDCLVETQPKKQLKKKMRNFIDRKLEMGDQIQKKTHIIWKLWHYQQNETKWMTKSNRSGERQ